MNRTRIVVLAAPAALVVAAAIVIPVSIHVHHEHVHELAYQGCVDRALHDLRQDRDQYTSDAYTHAMNKAAGACLDRYYPN